MRAARILIVLALVGAGVRVVARGPEPPGSVAYRQTTGLRPARDSVVRAAERRAGPLRRGEKIDPNRASAAELARLPRIGPALAARIVAFRDSSGPSPFRTLSDLERVAGIGPGVTKALAPYLTVGSRVDNDRRATSVPPTIRLNTATEAELAALPGIGPVRARAIVEDRKARGRFRNLDELTRVRGIGVATVERIRGRVRVP